jgi:hypothetical protein
VDLLERFKNPDEGTSKNELSRIFEGLIKSSPTEGRDAAQHAIDHPYLYNGKIVKRARKVIHSPVLRPPHPRQMMHVKVVVVIGLGGVESRQSLAEVKKGDVLTLTFKKECIEDLVYLEAMVCYCLGYTSPRDAAVVQAVLQSNDWGFDGNRTMCLRATCDFTDREIEFFVGRMFRPLEKLTITYRRQS